MVARFIERLESIRCISQYFDKKTLSQVLKYLIVGFSSFALEYGSFALLVKVFKVYYIISNIVVFTIIFWFNFLLNRLWSFKSKQAFGKQLFKYSLLYIFNLVVANFLLISLFTENFGFDPLISKILIMVPVVSWNFVLYKTVIYK